MIVNPVRSKVKHAYIAANQAMSGIVASDFAALSKAITESRVQVNTAYLMLQNTQSLAGQLQMQLRLEKPWEVGGGEYLELKTKLLMRQYQCVLDELERLVIMRLFELSKLSMAGTGI